MKRLNFILPLLLAVLFCSAAYSHSQSGQIIVDNRTRNSISMAFIYYDSTRGDWFMNAWHMASANSKSVFNFPLGNTIFWYGHCYIGNRHLYWPNHSEHYYRVVDDVMFGPYNTQFMGRNPHSAGFQEIIAADPNASSYTYTITLTP